MSAMELSVRYYIKTHQYGLTEENVKRIRPPDTKQLFVYKFLVILVLVLKLIYAMVLGKVHCGHGLPLGVTVQLD
jgi:hypothetical protein